MHLAPQAQQVLLDYKVIEDPKDNQGFLARQALREKKVYQEHQDNQAGKEKEVPEVLQVHRVLWVPLGNRVHLVCKDFVENKAHQVQLERLAAKEKRVCVDQQDQEDPLGPQENKAFRASKVCVACQVCVGPKENEESLVRRERRELMAGRDLQDYKVKEVPQAQEENKAYEAHLANRVNKAQEVSYVSLLISGAKLNLITHQLDTDKSIVFAIYLIKTIYIYFRPTRITRSGRSTGRPRLSWAYRGYWTNWTYWTQRSTWREGRAGRTGH